MLYQIRHKESGDIIKMRSGKSSWNKPAHAKAAWAASGLDHNDRKKYGYSPSGSRYGYGRECWRFDAQDQFEIVKIENIPTGEFAKALALLHEASGCLHDGAYNLYDKIEAFLKENKYEE